MLQARQRRKQQQRRHVSEKIHDGRFHFAREYPFVCQQMPPRPMHPRQNRSFHYKLSFLAKLSACTNLIKMAHALIWAPPQAPFWALGELRTPTQPHFSLGPAMQSKPCRPSFKIRI